MDRNGGDSERKKVSKTESRAPRERPPAKDSWAVFSLHASDVHFHRAQSVRINLHVVSIFHPVKFDCARAQWTSFWIGSCHVRQRVVGTPRHSPGLAYCSTSCKRSVLVLPVEYWGSHWQTWVVTSYSFLLPPPREMEVGNVPPHRGERRSPWRELAGRRERGLRHAAARRWEPAVLDPARGGLRHHLDNSCSVYFSPQIVA